MLVTFALHQNDIAREENSTAEKSVLGVYRNLTQLQGLLLTSDLVFGEQVATDKYWRGQKYR